ncbi:unnamed protein product [Adineta steineri]|uniref:RING-type domain-containing protein n=1 Tax=Adineta steineri TaxID=433720 RepID=A0A815AUE4_9BILA|nr:unnamed protein product [Adineta steineri]CAF1550339.1 unnamed protein product [Adineta steineri]
MENGQTIATCKRLTQKPGVHSVNAMKAAGFHYTNDKDAARCDACGLEVSGWTIDMKPFTIHSQRSSTCTFIRSIKPKGMISASSILNPTSTISTLIADEPFTKRRKVEVLQNGFQLNVLTENMLKQVRQRTFSHWPHRIILSTAQMIESGFFYCNVGDRVICIYCNLICQQWTPHTDDPCEVHKTLSPNCIYVTAKLIRPAASSIIIVNENSTSSTQNMNSSTATGLDPLRSNEIVFTAVCNPAYTEIPKRHASFGLWPAENLPSIDDLVRAGFFYTGTKTIVTCFYCNGSLENWQPNHDPMIEHAQWFPHCAYAKQLCGDDLYRKIQESKRAQQERARANESKEKAALGMPASTTTTTSTTTDNGQLLIPDESTLSELVKQRLGLPISQRLLDQKFKLSIIKRCWEDQLRLKQDDFVSECDLYIACLILQKQIEHIDSKEENVVIPKMRTPEQTLATTQSMTNFTDADMTTSSPSSTNESISTQSSVNSTSSNPCSVCLTEETRLACIPCGHLATCVPCGHSLRSCPICRRKIESFVRIYI